MSRLPGYDCPRWRKGDVVRVIYHSHEPRAVGMVFRVENFSTMDFMEDHPTIKNPWYDRSDWPRSALNLRFNPGWLVPADVLEQLTVL